MYLFFLFDTHWADLACALENLDSVDQVPTALKVLSNDDRDYALRILLKAETIEATPQSLKALDRQLNQLDAVIKEVSDSIQENSDQLKALRRMLRSDGKTTRGEAAVLVSDKGNIRARVRQDQKRRSALVIERARLKETIEQSRAYFARAELVKYCQSDRSRLTPRRAANAIAGFPFIGWRQSARRCVNLEDNKEAGGFRYATIKIIRRILKSWNGETDLVVQAKHYLENRRPSPSRIFSELWSNWRHLRLSISEVNSKELNRDTLLCAIASRYFRRSSGPITELEAYLVRKEQILRGNLNNRKNRLSGSPPVSAGDKP